MLAYSVTQRRVASLFQNVRCALAIELSRSSPFPAIIVCSGQGERLVRDSKGQAPRLRRPSESGVVIGDV